MEVIRAKKKSTYANKLRDDASNGNVTKIQEAIEGYQQKRLSMALDLTSRVSSKENEVSGIETQVARSCTVVSSWHISEGWTEERDVR
jgi:hypothetical protein